MSALAVNKLPQGFLESKSFRDTLVVELKNALGPGTVIDENLVDYVCLLIYNQHTQKQFESDLVAFFGEDQATQFTKWVWSYLTKIINNVKAGVEVEGDDKKSAVTD